MTKPSSETLLFFEPDLSTKPKPAHHAVVSTLVPPITQQAQILQEASRKHLSRSDTDWGWEELRDFVAAEITRRFGVFPRDVAKEFGIFKNFIDRWDGKVDEHGVRPRPGRAAQIARYAFEVCDGRWRGAPVKVQRFCKNSDPYFATPIDQFLTDNHL